MELAGLGRARLASASLQRDQLAHRVGGALAGDLHVATP
jgi:hypothetical protein